MIINMYTKSIILFNKSKDKDNKQFLLLPNQLFKTNHEPQMVQQHHHNALCQ